MIADLIVFGSWSALLGLVFIVWAYMVRGIIGKIVYVMGLTQFALGLIALVISAVAAVANSLV